MPGTGEADPGCHEEILGRINGLLEGDHEMGQEIHALERARNIRMRYFNLRIEEEVAPIEAKLAAVTERRASARQAALELWARHFDSRPRLDLPVGMTSRCNRRELVVRDKARLLDALDRIDRLDLTDYTFDLKGLLQLLDKRKLDLPGDVLEVINHFVIQIRPREE